MSDNGKHEPHAGHAHGPGCGCGHDHGHEHHHHHAPQSPEALAAAAAVSRILSEAGYDVTDGETFKRGAAALMAAQMVAVSAGLAGKAGAGVSADGKKVGRNDPCPCGSGKKYKKCCLDKEPSAPPAADPIANEFGGVRPKMIPQMDLDSMQADTATLGALFQRDPALRKCRFDAARMANYLEPHAGHVPTNLQERDRWIALRAHGFVTAEHERDGDQGDALLSLRGLKEALLSAAGRCPQDDEALRALALGLLYHSSWAPGLEAPHPLETLLFRLTLQETAVEQQTRASLVHTLGDDPDELARRIAAGDPEAAAQWQASFDELPEKRRMELLQAAERYHDRVLETIVAGTFPVPLPLASVLPLVIETVKVARDAGDEEAAREAARQLAVRRAREGLDDGDRALYVELCDGWLASGEADSDEEADQVRYARGLASVGASSLEPVLLLAFLDHHRVTPIPEEPSPDPASGLEIDSPAFLERYGAFLADLGHSDLAVRTWRLSRFAGPIPDAIQDRITEAQAAIADHD